MPERLCWMPPCDCTGATCRRPSATGQAPPAANPSPCGSSWSARKATPRAKRGATCPSPGPPASPANTPSASSAKLAADPYALRCKLLATLPCVAKEKPHIERQPRTADLLFRVEATDSGPIVLIQTSARPAWDTLELAPLALRCAPES